MDLMDKIMAVCLLTLTFVLFMLGVAFVIFALKVVEMIP